MMDQVSQDQIVMITWLVLSVIIFIGAMYEASVLYIKKKQYIEPLLIAAAAPVWGYLAVGVLILAVFAVPFVVIMHLLFKTSIMIVRKIHAIN